MYIYTFHHNDLCLNWNMERCISLTTFKHMNKDFKHNVSQCYLITSWLDVARMNSILIYIFVEDRYYAISMPLRYIPVRTHRLVSISIGVYKTKHNSWTSPKTWQCETKLQVWPDLGYDNVRLRERKKTIGGRGQLKRCNAFKGIRRNFQLSLNEFI